MLHRRGRKSWGVQSSDLVFQVIEELLSVCQAWLVAVLLDRISAALL